MRVLHGFACAVLASTAYAQTAASLPQNYKVILENSDVLVQRVHYGPHEFVPTHDHPAATAVYVYLNDSGVVDITHEGPDGSTVHRPPTHTGAFRISPGNSERHSIQNTSDLPSDFLRVELKRLPPGTVQGDFRAPAAIKPLVPGTTTLFKAQGVRIERVICQADCVLTDSSVRAVVIPFRGEESPLPANDFDLPLDRLEMEALWTPNLKDRIIATGHGSKEPMQILRIILTQP